MDDVEWVTCSHPIMMLEHLRGQASDRKLRLFAIACCHQVRDLLTSNGFGEDLAVVERFADGLATEEELRSVHLRLPDSPTNQAATLTAHAAAVGTVGACSILRAEASGNLTNPKSEGDYYAGEAGEMRRQCRLFRDIIGNPFRPVTVDPDWLTSTVNALAQIMYEHRDFSPMPILADALQDAGCDNTDILNHCRGPGPHVRGCWVRGPGAGEGVIRPPD